MQSMSYVGFNQMFKEQSQDIMTSLSGITKQQSLHR